MTTETAAGLTLQTRKQQAELSFSKAKEVLTDLSKLGMEIKEVSNDQHLGVCNDALDRISRAEKKVEAKRVELKAPALEEGKFIDAIAKEMQSIISGAKTHLQKMKLDYLQKAEEERLAVIRKAQEEEARQEEEKRKQEELLKGLHFKLADYGKNAIIEISEAITDQDCKDMFVKWVKDFPGEETWGAINEQAQQVKQFIQATGKAKRSTILYAYMLSNCAESQKEEFAQQLKEAKAVLGESLAKYSITIKEQKQQVQNTVIEVANRINEKMVDINDKRIDAETEKVKGLRKIWDYELGEKGFANVPDEWKLVTLNTSAITEYIKANKAVIKEGEEINGVRFFQKVGLSGK